VSLILIVDDEPDIREFLRAALGAHGHECDEAASGAEAVQMAKKKRYDLIIMDRMMPRMSGIQATAALRREPACAGVKIWVCTAADVTKEVEAAFKAGADDYLAKPIDLKVLAQKLLRHLGPKTA